MEAELSKSPCFKFKQRQTGVCINIKEFIWTNLSIDNCSPNIIVRIKSPPQSCKEGLHQVWNTSLPSWSQHRKQFRRRVDEKKVFLGCKFSSRSKSLNCDCHQIESISHFFSGQNKTGNKVSENSKDGYDCLGYTLNPEK